VAARLLIGWGRKVGGSLALAVKDRMLNSISRGSVSNSNILASLVGKPPLGFMQNKMTNPR
jgi:hypothetical protein